MFFFYNFQKNFDIYIYIDGFFFFFFERVSTYGVHSWWALFIIRPRHQSVFGVGGDSGDSRNFIQGVPISLWKNFESFWSISGHFGKYWLKFKIWLAWSLCLKKNVLKTKTNLHFVHQKNHKKKKKRKRNEQCGLYTINWVSFLTMCVFFFF